MEITKWLWGAVVGLPTIILGLVVVAFPSYATYLILILVGLWIAAVIVWLSVRNRELAFEIAALRKPRPSSKPMSPPPAPSNAPAPSASSWKLMVDIDIVLEGDWEATQKFRLKAGDTIRVSATARNRFILYLANRVGDKAFDYDEETPPTTSVTRPFDIESDGTYAVVVEPVGDAPFHVSIRVEKEMKPGVIAFDY